MGTNPDITSVERKFRCSNGGGIADRFFSLIVRYSRPIGSSGDDFSRDVWESSKVVSSLLSNIRKLRIGEAGYFKNYREQRPICIAYVDRALVVKQTSHPTKGRHGFLQPFDDFINRGFKSQLTYEQAVAQVNKVHPVNASKAGKAKMLEALEQLKTLREAYQRVFRYIPFCGENKATKEKLLKLCKDFLNVFAYEVVFAIPRY